MGGGGEPTGARAPSAFATFLRPTRTRLVFLAEWTLFIAFSAARGRLGTVPRVLVAVYTLVFYYLVGCSLAAWSRRDRHVATGWRLVAGGVALAGLDQAAKALVAAGVPLGASLPVVPGWLHLAHVHNTHGSWVASEFQLRAAGALLPAQWIAAGLLLVLSFLGHRYYVGAHRRSLWIDLAFLGVFSSQLSWMGDMALRGSTLDYIGLPGLVTADLKDILVGIGVAALFAETLEHPRLWWNWSGRRA